MKITTSNYDGTPILGGHCSIIITSMNYQSSGRKLLSPSSTNQNNFLIHGNTRQFHIASPNSSSSNNSDNISQMVQQICQPIAEAVLTYAEAVKSEKRLPKPEDFKMTISSSTSAHPHPPSTFQIPRATLQNIASISFKYHNKNYYQPPKVYQYNCQKQKQPIRQQSRPNSLPEFHKSYQQKSPMVSPTSTKVHLNSTESASEKISLNKSLQGESSETFSTKNSPSTSNLLEDSENTPVPSPSTSHPPENMPKTCKPPLNLQNSRCPWRNQPVKQNLKVPDKRTFEKRTITSPPMHRNISWNCSNSKKRNNVCVEASKRKIYQKSQNKFWQKTPDILKCSWRTNTPITCSNVAATDQCSKPSVVEVNHVKKNVMCGESTKVEAMMDFCRDRRQSESSQTSEDSFVVFDRDSGCSYDSEVSSYDSDSDEESDSDEDSTLSDSSVSSLSHVHDSGLTSESDTEGHTLQVGDSLLSLPPRHPVPPARTSSKSSMSDADSDDDFIVFGSESEDDSCDETDFCASQNEEDKPRSDIKVHFAATEEICYFYDDDDARQARCGEWEEMARDRSRFKARINTTSEILSPILNPEHRNKVLQRLNSNNKKQ